jgi:hypothetical protein
MGMAKSDSFSSRYQPRFDAERDQWVLKVPNNDVTTISDDFCEVRLPIYASRVLAIGATSYALAGRRIGTGC